MRWAALTSRRARWSIQASACSWVEVDRVPALALPDEPVEPVEPVRPWLDRPLRVPLRLVGVLAEGEEPLETFLTLGPVLEQLSLVQARFRDFRDDGELVEVDHRPTTVLRFREGSCESSLRGQIREPHDCAGISALFCEPECLDKRRNRGMVYLCVCVNPSNLLALSVLSIIACRGRPEPPDREMMRVLRQGFEPDTNPRSARISVLRIPSVRFLLHSLRSFRRVLRQGFEPWSLP